jgi:hypothetical protein
MVDRVDVSWALPAGSHTECCCQPGDLQPWSYAADVVKPDFDKIDQSVRYQAGSFDRMAKQFAHSGGNAALLPHHLEIVKCSTTMYSILPSTNQ